MRLFCILLTLLFSLSGAAMGEYSDFGRWGIAANGGVRFGQQGISATFRNGEFAGQALGDVSAGLRSGAISPNQLPLQTVVRDGITYSMNNRSLMTLRQAGMEPTVIKDVTGNAFFERQLTERLAEMGGHPPASFVPIIRTPKP